MSKINNINRREFLEVFGVCSCGLIMTSCSTAPITDRKQLKLLPESSLNRQAAQIYEKVKRKTKLSDDKKQLEEIKEIGSNIEESVMSILGIHEYLYGGLPTLFDVSATICNTSPKHNSVSSVTSTLKIELTLIVMLSDVVQLLASEILKV